MTYILVTNDDGVNAPGILALAQAMRQLADTVAVIAPAQNQSAGGHKKTLYQDIQTGTTTLADGTPATVVEGSPADCIALAALGLVQWPPRLVVSGINRGGNLGQDVTYSGTVTAALEATIQGVPAVAVSLNHREANTVEDYAVASEYAQRVVRAALMRDLPPFTVLSLNVPAGNQVRGLRLARQGVRIYHDALVRNGDVVRIAGDEPTGRHQDLGTDLWAVHNGYASLTPLTLDLTAHPFMAELAAWDLGFEG